MANNINFRGEVNEMSAAYFCREMDTLPARSSASVYLHTPGGDIYAGGEMINSLRSAQKRGCKISVEVGSLCASMGAAFLAAARAGGCKAVAHSNTEVMFHGCWSIVLGGADELTDQAKAMRDFNECVRKDLKKCGIDDTEAWFAADRQKWLNAEELRDLGLVDEIVEDASTDADFKQDAVKIAAKLNHKETVQMDEVKKEAEETAPIVETPVVEDAKVEAVEAPAEETKVETPAPVVEDDLEQKIADLANKRFAGLQAKHDKMISDLTSARDAALKELAEANAKVTSLTGDIEKANADLAELRNQLTEAERNRESVVVAALTPSTEITPEEVIASKASTPEAKIAAAMEIARKNRAN